MPATITLTPTYQTGATSKSLPSVSVPPDRRVNDDMLVSTMADVGMNTVFIADLLSGVLAHEQCGRHLYRSVAGRTNNPLLESKYEHFGAETEHHVELVTELIGAAGGDPMYVSPLARAVKATDTSLLESTFLLSDSVDIMTAEMVMLDAVVIAETVDHANWLALEALGERLSDGPLKESFTRIVTEVLDEENEHLAWANETRLRMTSLLAGHGTIASAGAKVEHLVARVKSLFD